MASNYYGISGFIILLLDIWALINILNSTHTSGTKALWVILVLFLPVAGFVIWLIAGPRSST